MYRRVVATVTIVPDLEFAREPRRSIADLPELAQYIRRGQVIRSACEVNSSGWQPSGSGGSKPNSPMKRRMAIDASPGEHASDDYTAVQSQNVPGLHDIGGIVVTILMQATHPGAYRSG